MILRIIMPTFLVEFLCTKNDMVSHLQSAPGVMHSGLLALAHCSEGKSVGRTRTGGSAPSPYQVLHFGVS